MSTLHSYSQDFEFPRRPSRRFTSPTATRRSRPEHTKSRHSFHRLSSSTSSPSLSATDPSSNTSSSWSEPSSDSESPSTPVTDPQSDSDHSFQRQHDSAEVDLTKVKSGLASTKLVTQDPELLAQVAGDGQTGTQLLQKYCCGGGCCFLQNQPATIPESDGLTPIELPVNEAFKSLELKLGALSLETDLTNISNLPARICELTSIKRAQTSKPSSVYKHPPEFVQPHPPYHVFSAPVYHARELTKPGAEKRTYHFDIDVTDYPDEAGVDFKVGGAVGICPPNSDEHVNDVFNILGVPTFVRDKPVILETTSGRWPTIWGEEEARQLRTTRRELLSWCVDIQSYPPTKNLLRLLAEHATESNERQILLYLCSAQGQGAFCDLRTGSHISLSQLLRAFPSSRPPLEDLFSVLPQLMPRFYSLSNDPHVSSEREGLSGRRVIEVAVTVAESEDWTGSKLRGVGSGFLERIARTFISAEEEGVADQADLRIPLFRGLMANPLSKEFGVSDGPMMLIGAGVGMAPFRGFILNRLRNANCASKIWLVQGVRDSSVDELYSGELGQYESEIKRVVQSRGGANKQHARKRLLSQASKNLSETDLAALKFADATSGPGAKGRWRTNEKKLESRYVQDEVKQQADIVWDIINSIDGRVFVCGSSKGMGEGVEDALCEVAMQKGGFEEEAARAFWDGMKENGKYIAETW